MCTPHEIPTVCVTCRHTQHVFRRSALTIQSPIICGLQSSTMLRCVGSSVQQALEGEVLAATSGASFKLIFICAVVGWMLKTVRLPKATASVLTQVKPVLNSTCRTILCVCSNDAIFTRQHKSSQRIPATVLSGVLALCVQVVYTSQIPRLTPYSVFIRCRATFIVYYSGLSHAGGRHRADTLHAVH